MYLRTHLGLGDQVICCGLAREIAKKENDVKFFTKKVNYPSVFAMLKDVPSITLVRVRDDNRVKKILKRDIANRKMLLGFYGDGWRGNDYDETGMAFDENLYDQSGIDFEKRWSSFYVNRDRKKEKEVFEKYDISGEYCFCHETPKCYRIDRSRVFNPVFPDRNISDNIFDFRVLIENAAEVHLIESCFLHWLDATDIGEKLYAHRYARPQCDFTIPTYKRDWTILT